MTGAALLLGGAGAIGWAGAGLLTAPSSRALGPARAVLWLGLAGVPFGALLAIIGGPLRIRASELVAILAAGAFLLVATQVWSILAGRAQMSLAAPIVACDGAIAALAAVLTGHRLPVAAYAGLSLMVAGLVVMSGSGSRSTEEAEETLSPGAAPPPLSGSATIWLAILAAVGYGGMLFCAGSVEGTSPLWTVTIARAVATLGALVICLAQGSVRPVRKGVPFAFAAGICDFAAFSLFVAGARHDPAIAAVAASQYGAVAVLLAIVFLGERLTKVQAISVAVLVAGAGVVAGAE